MKWENYYKIVNHEGQVWVLEEILVSALIHINNN